MTPQLNPIPPDVVLKSGSHASMQAGMCAMEFASHLAGEPFSDEPQCVCPVIRNFMVAWNDALPDDTERTRLLLPLIPQTLDTRSTKAVEEYRAYMAFDWLTRVYTPAWLDLIPSLATHAADLRALPPVMDLATARAAEPVASAAESAAESAAKSAAKSAAWSAAASALRPTQEQVQLLAADLVLRMVAVTPENLPAGWVPPSTASA